MEINYLDDMYIDESALDVEWLNQPPLALKYGAYFSVAKRDLAKAEEKIKIVRSELVKNATEDPDKHLGQGIKPTSPIVEAFYRNHEKHKKAKKKVIRLQYECDIAEIAKNEMSFTRKATLENLVILHGQQYFAGPQVPRNLTKKWAEKKEDTARHERISKDLRKTE